MIAKNFSARLLLLLAALPAWQVHAQDAEKLYEKLSPSVWVVIAGNKSDSKVASGSAVVIEKEKLITNCHVLRGADWINVKRQNTMHRARLLHSDIARDLCILKVDELTSPSVAIAPLRSAKVGQRVFAIGAPQGLELTLSDGLISSLHSNDNGEITEIQISTPISHGSSGGGLFDKDGKLLGITTATLAQAQNINFALPAEWIAGVWGKPATPVPASMAAGGTQRAASGASGAPPGRALSGSEIRSHFAEIEKAKAVGPDDKQYMFRLLNDREFILTYRDRSSATHGQYRIERGRLCLAPQEMDWRSWQGCYQLFELANGQFQLRSETGKTFLNYAKP